jgi:peptidoglycan/LPS O-acetylase OafA/YrhL
MRRPVDFRPMADASADTSIVALSPPSDSRWQILAGLRFLLAMVVVAGHLNWFAPHSQPWMFLESLGGTSAVLGFLIISGYSIAHSLQRRPAGFFRRRLLRIYPLYVAAVLLALVPFYSGASAFRVPGNTFARPQVWVVFGNLLMLQNIVCEPIDSNILVWTLGIEVICYSLAPVFHRAPLPLLLVLIAISAGAYAAYPHMGFGHYATVRFGVPLLVFAWAWIAGFVLQRLDNSVPVGIAITGLCIALTLINRLYNTPNSVYCIVGAALIVLFAQRIRLPRSVGTVMNYLGDLSYPMYLFHLPSFLLAYGIMNITSGFGLIMTAFAISAAFLLVESILKPILSHNRNYRPTPG